MGKCLFCNNNNYVIVYEFFEPPKLEVRFPGIDYSKYHRIICKCNFCGHYFAQGPEVSDEFYKKDYVTGNYSDISGIYEKFKKIINLNPELSDNENRVKYILTNVMGTFKNCKDKTVLDVGSGLCVFLYKMQQNGFICTALDPDERNVQHAEENLGIKAVCTDYLVYQDMTKYDLITMNKVLEHVNDPIYMLAKTKMNLKDNGLIYIEVPDGEKASLEDEIREEFFFDHIHVFSQKSCELLIRKSGFRVVKIESVREPSSKFTIRAIITK